MLRKLMIVAIALTLSVFATTLNVEEAEATTRVSPHSQNHNFDSWYHRGGHDASGSGSGYTCISPGNKYMAYFDWKATNNKVYFSNYFITVGSDWTHRETWKGVNGHAYGRCMGRCGSNCWGHPRGARGYTEDCLEHDMCSILLRASGGGSHKNCGDEYNAAVNDTVASTFRTCRYSSGFHTKAARGHFGVGLWK